MGGQGYAAEMIWRRPMHVVLINIRDTRSYKQMFLVLEKNVQVVKRRVELIYTV